MHVSLKKRVLYVTSTLKLLTRSSWPAAKALCPRSKKPKILHVKFVAFQEAGKVAAALCHYVSILRYAMLKNGSPLVRGKIFTGFSNMEKNDADEMTWAMVALPRGQQIMPRRIEDEVKRLGGVLTLWRRYAGRDGNLITGQQQFSGGDVGELVVRGP
jgi:putative intracellular protease/amidase